MGSMQDQVALGTETYTRQCQGRHRPPGRQASHVRMASAINFREAVPCGVAGGGRPGVLGWRSLRVAAAAGLPIRRSATAVGCCSESLT